MTMFSIILCINTAPHSPSSRGPPPAPPPPPLPTWVPHRLFHLVNHPHLHQTICNRFAGVWCHVIFELVSLQFAMSGALTAYCWPPCWCWCWWRRWWRWLPGRRWWWTEPWCWLVWGTGKRGGRGCQVNAFIPPGVTNTALRILPLPLPITSTHKYYSENPSSANHDTIQLVYG